MSQSFIRVDAGTGSAVDFSTLTTSGNYRQVVTIGDPNTDAMYSTVDAKGLNVHGTFTLSGGDRIAVYGLTAGTAINVSGTVTSNLPAGSVIGVYGVGGTLISVNATITNTPNVAVTSMPAVTNVTGSVNAYQQTDAIYNGATILTPLFTAIAFSGNGNNTVLSAVGGKRLRVLSMALVASTATGLHITDGPSGPGIYASSAFTSQFAANGGIVLPFNPLGWFQTTSGSAVVFNISATSSIGGSLTYVQV